MSVQSLDNEQGIHVSHSITFDGNVTAWDTKTIDLSSISNEANTFDNKRRISDVTVRISDIDGVIWDALGHGTTAFGKGFKVITTIGGQYGQTTFGQVDGYGFTGTVGGTQFTSHTGSVVEVQKSDRSVLIRSKNNMERVSDLTFKFPVDLDNEIIIDHTKNYENFSFDTTMTEGVWDTILKSGGWDINDERKGCKLGVYSADTGDSEDIDSSDLYGTDHISIPSTYSVMTDDWDRLHNKIILTGTFLGSHTGTMNDNNTARQFGYSNLTVANDAQHFGDDGTFYPIDKVRVKWPQGTAQAVDKLYPSCAITMHTDYTSVLKYMLAGRFIYRGFLEADLDSTTFDESLAIGASSAFRGTIFAKDDKVSPYIDNVLTVTNGMFSVNNNNVFQYTSYGPVLLTGENGTILQQDVINSSLTNRREQAYNAFEIRYKYDNDSNDYNAKVTGTLANWTIDTERLLTLKSKWMANDNEAEVFKDQLKTKYEKTSPAIAVTTALNKSTVEIGDLLTVTDVNSGLNSKVVQVRKFNKDFPNRKVVDFEMFDAETLYYGRGWSFWGTEASGGNIVPTAVSSTSTSGFADGSDQVANINTTIYGTAFKWW